MTKSELAALKQKAMEQKEKSGDMDVIVAEIFKLPYGQAKKVLTAKVLAVLEKYGYTEG